MKYKTIIADPPWSYSNKKTGGSMKSGANQKYSTLTIDELCNLKVSSIVDDTAVLFLWCTTPLNPTIPIKVMEAWGFEYKTKAYWYKLGRIGMGFWFRNQVEECLVGIRGKVIPWRSNLKNIFEYKASEHSKKPLWIHEFAEKYCEKPYLELFARNNRVGWDCFGNEVKNSINL